MLYFSRFSRFLAQIPPQSRETHKTKPGCSVFDPVWKWDNLCGKPAPMSDCLHAENIFVLFKSKPQCFNFRVCLIKIYIITIFEVLILHNDAGLFTQLCP